MSNDRLRELAQGATPGPWAPFADTKNPAYGRVGCVASAATMDPVSTGSSGSDAAYIAAASPDRILILLDENERLRVAVKLLQDNWHKTVPAALDVRHDG